MSEQLIEAHDAAYQAARDCKVYAPLRSVDEGVALYHATRSGATSAARSHDWMVLYRQMKRLGLKSERYPHLFKEMAK